MSAPADLTRAVSSCAPHHAQESLLPLVIVVQSPDSVLPDVLAMHTLEMIPKSMILMLTGECQVMYQNAKGF